jgi:hypothetical protein
MGCMRLQYTEGRSARSSSYNILGCCWFGGEHFGDLCRWLSCKLALEATKLLLWLSELNEMMMPVMCLA